MVAVFRFFRSVKLAVVLILVITALSAVATLIPQGRDHAFYFQQYPLPVARLILALGAGRFFSSPIFLVPVVLFFINLAVCTLDRLLTRSRSGVKRRHGPDLVHIGLLLLVVGALFSLRGRQEGMTYLGEGDPVRLPGGYQLRLLSFQTLLYPDGRPREWISAVEVSLDGQVVIPSFAIEVNRPLKIGGMSVYQTTYGREDRAVLRDPQGNRFSVTSGSGLDRPGGLLLFRGIDQPEGGGTGAGVFELWEGRTRRDAWQVRVAGTVDGLAVEEYASRELTGLKVVKDPGFAVVLIALIMVAAGLSLTYIQKRKDLGI